MEDELLIKYIQKNCSKKEEETVRHWLTHTSDHRRLFELEEIYALKNEIHYQKTVHCEAAYQRLEKVIAATPHSHKAPAIQPPRWRNYLSIAATIALLCLLSLNLYYATGNSQTAETLAFHTLTVPKGQRASLQLSDGTQVWLNADSKLSYPAQFEPGKRQVILEGEAYFEVTANPQRPFWVQLPDLNIKVLGTKFNAKAYAGECHCITLSEGKVEVSTADGSQTEQMEPKDQIYYAHKGTFKHLKNREIPTATDWIQGDLRIDNLTLADFIPDLERHYDIDIHIQDASLPAIRFTCHFKKDIGIQEALELLKATKQIDYIIDRKDIYLYKYKPLRK